MNDTPSIKELLHVVRGIAMAARNSAQNEELIDLIYRLFLLECSSLDAHDKFVFFDDGGVPAFEDARKLLIRVGKIREEECMR